MKETERRYHDGEYMKNHPTWDSKDSQWKASRILKMIRHNKLEVRTIYEVGCGAGEILNCLHSGMKFQSEDVEGIRFCGYEISPQAYDLCRVREKEGLTFRLGDFLSEEVEGIDLLLVIDVFEHVEDYLGFLRALRSKAEYKIFHIPLDLSVQSVFRKDRLMRDRERSGHLHHFSRETALATLRDSGYEILDWFYTAGSLELPSSTIKNKLARLPRRGLYIMNKGFASRLLGGFSLMVLAN